MYKESGSCRYKVTCAPKYLSIQMANKYNTVSQIHHVTLSKQDEFSNFFISKYNTLFCMSSCKQTSAGNNDKQQAGNYDPACSDVSLYNKTDT